MIYKHLIFLVLFSIALIGCEPVEKAKLPANEPYLSMIRGQVSIIQPLDEKGNPKNLSGPVILLLIDKANPPPPLGLGTPNISVIPEGSIDRSFLFGKVKPGTYEIRAILDHNNNFNPLFDFYTSADSGDLAGGHIDKIDPNTGITIFKAIEVKEQSTVTNIDVLLAKEIKTNLPTFQIVSAPELGVGEPVYSRNAYSCKGNFDACEDLSNLGRPDDAGLAACRCETNNCQSCNLDSDCKNPGELCAAGTCRSACGSTVSILLNNIDIRISKDAAGNSLSAEKQKVIGGNFSVDDNYPAFVAFGVKIKDNNGNPIINPASGNFIFDLSPSGNLVRLCGQLLKSLDDVPPGKRKLLSSSTPIPPDSENLVIGLDLRECDLSTGAPVFGNFAPAGTYQFWLSNTGTSQSWKIPSAVLPFLSETDQLFSGQNIFLKITD